MIKITFGEFTFCLDLFLALIVHAHTQNHDDKIFTYIQNDDPELHLEHFTYGRLTFLRGHVIGEQNLNRKGDCSATCSDYNRTQYYQHHYNSSLKQTIQCNGNIYRCKNINHFSTFSTMRIDNQLYELIMNKETNEMEFRKFNDHFAHIYWSTNHKFAMHDTLYDSSHCQMCKCYCDDIYNKHSVRSFCQDLVSSNTKLGYVITGIRFRMIERIIYLEIQQGKLINGKIEPSTVHWKSSNPCQYYGFFNYDHRSLQLDDVIIPNGQVVTAVTWNRYDRPTKIMGRRIGRVSLSIRSTSIDSRGNLIHKDWFAYHRYDARRNHLKISRVDIPTSVTRKSKEMSVPNKNYIKFRPTDWTRDFAQHVVPFIDLQEVFTNPPTAISGVGVYYRASNGYGGFVALKLILKN